MTKSLVHREADRALSSRDRLDMISAIRLIDEEGGVDDQPINAALTSAFWNMAVSSGARSWVDQAWTIYRLVQKVGAKVLVNDQLRQATVEGWEVWESIRAGSERGEPMYSWREFCLNRLGMNHKIASTMKRAYEVFAITLGLSHAALERAGKRKLERAAPIVGRDWQRGVVDEKMQELLFGEPHVCLACKEWVDYDHEGTEECPHCGQPYAELQPGTFGQVDAYALLRNAEQRREEVIESNVYDYSMAGEQDDRERPLVTWVRRPGDLMATPYEIGRVTRFGGKLESTSESGGILGEEELGEAWEILEAGIRKAGRRPSST